MSILARSHVEGFELFRLENHEISVEVIPALGGKIAQITDRRSGREWLWQPEPVNLRTNEPGDDFASSTLVGCDECLPTVAACRLGERQLPDHGELWAVPWMLDEAAAVRGALALTARAPRSPFEITREIRLDGPSITLDYRLTNAGGRREPYLWALHPLFAIRTGDRIVLPPEIATLRIESVLGATELEERSQLPWPQPTAAMRLDWLELGAGAAAVKLFATMPRGEARIVNDRTGEWLAMRFDAADLPYLGVWISRGGWKGHHHFALEPTTSCCDALDQALLEDLGFGVIAAGETRCWSVSIAVG